KLAAFWKHKLYLVIDEVSMIARKFFTKLSTSIRKGKSLAGEKSEDKPFGGVNSTVLYYPCDPSKDSAEKMLGQKIYKQFTTVVRLKEQVHVTDPQWNDLLCHIRHGSCNHQHIKLLRSLILTNSQCPPTDFNSSPWNDAILVTPHHAVHHQWNSKVTKNYCQQSHNQLFICWALDMTQGQRLTLEESFTVAMKPKGFQATGNDHALLSNMIEIAVGMKVMVTFNIKTDLDIANRARGELVEIVSDKQESSFSPTKAVVELEYPPAYFLIKLDCTKA
ncbi:uncharacterized protein HD556DRAFT_1217533, partial [Suillus plorans]